MSELDELHRGDLASFAGWTYVVSHFFRSAHDGLLHIELRPPPYELGRFAGRAYVGYITERHPDFALQPRALGEEPERIAQLRRDVAGLPVDEDYRRRLLRSIDLYHDHILARPFYLPHEGWDDLEALQQVTLGDLIEESHRNQFERGR